jgi:hypothetical protein
MWVTYRALRRRAHISFIEDWKALAPAPPEYGYPRSLSPYPFMGLGKFMAGRLHQMPSMNSYLSAQRSWFDKDEPDTCPRCSKAPETFTHAILECPAVQPLRTRLLLSVSSIAPSPRLWSSILLLREIQAFVSAAMVGCPHSFPDPWVSSPPAIPISPPRPLPPPGPTRVLLRRVVYVSFGL